MPRQVETKGWCYITATVKRTTDSAVLVWDGAIDAWLPRSQIEDPDEYPIGETLEFLLPEWLAKDKGLI